MILIALSYRAFQVLTVVTTKAAYGEPVSFNQLQQAYPTMDPLELRGAVEELLWLGFLTEVWPFVYELDAPLGGAAYPVYAAPDNIAVN